LFPGTFYIVYLIYRLKDIIDHGILYSSSRELLLLVVELALLLARAEFY